MFVAAADRMTPRQREAFTDVLAPLRVRRKEPSLVDEAESFGDMVFRLENENVVNHKN